MRRSAIRTTSARPLIEIENPPMDRSSGDGVQAAAQPSTRRLVVNPAALSRHRNSKVNDTNRTELTANSFSGGCWPISTPKIRYLRNRFPSERLLATPMFLIPWLRQPVSTTGGVQRISTEGGRRCSVPAKVSGSNRLGVPSESNYQTNG